MPEDNLGKKWEHLRPWDHQVRTALAAGDVHSAWDALVRGYQHPVVGYCIVLLGDRTDGEEVAQEVFMAAGKALQRFRQEASVRTWLFAIARHQCWKHRVRHRRRAHLYADYGDSIREVLHPDPSDLPDAERLETCLQGLKKRERDLLMQYYYLEEPVLTLRITLQALANKFWVSPTTIRRRLEAATAQLRACLQSGG